MANALSKVGVVILAAGKGKRMQGQLPLPKVLYPLAGRPMLSYLLESVRQSQIPNKSVVVIAPDLQVIPQTFGDTCEYAVQEEQLGTGHAVLCAKEQLRQYTHLLVIYGDHPLMSSATIDQLVSNHLSGQAEMTLATVRVPHFEQEFAVFNHYGRIVRDSGDRLVKIVEYKDASAAERNLTEVNPSYYVFKTAWLWESLAQLTPNNIQKEYYLTDVLQLATNQGRSVTLVPLADYREAVGINTPEQCRAAEQILLRKLSVPIRA